MKHIVPYLIVIVALTAEAQDPHFSQWFRAPASLNPAQTGSFDGHYRFFGNYRRQWAAISEPFVTAGIGAEARRPLRNIPLAAGISIYNDQAGTGALGTLQVPVINTRWEMTVQPLSISGFKVDGTAGR